VAESLTRKIWAAGLLAGAFMASPAVVAGGSMERLTDSELSNVEGQGVGVVLEDFTFSHGTDADIGQLFRIGGITTADGDAVDLTVNQLYITGSGSNYGQNLGPVNLGRLNNPYSLSLLDGDDPDVNVPGQAVIEFAAPRQVSASEGYNCLDSGAGAGSGTCSSRPAGDGYHGERPDMGLSLTASVGGSTNSMSFHATSAVIDGSYIRLWGDQDLDQLAGEIQLNFYTPELSITACDNGGGGCGDTISMNNFAMELSLGNEYQPFLMSVHGVDAEPDQVGNLRLQVQTIRQPGEGEIAADGSRAGSNTSSWDFYEEYYTRDDIRSSIHVGELQIGDQSFGSAHVDGMLIQHLDITTRDLTP